jgi:hypothetical protein
MSDTVSPQEVAELRSRLDQLAPPRPMFQSPQPPDPNSWAGQQGAIQEQKRQERIEAARIAHERQKAEEAAAAEAERQRKARNAPLIAELDTKIAALHERRDAEYRRHVRWLDNQLEELRQQRQELR